MRRQGNTLSEHRHASPCVQPHYVSIRGAVPFPSQVYCWGMALLWVNAWEVICIFAEAGANCGELITSDAQLDYIADFDLDYLRIEMPFS